MEFQEQGNTRALEELINRHSKSVVNFFYHLLGDETSADDLAQEVFIKLALSVKNYTPSAKFTTFLFRIAHNTWLDYVGAKYFVQRRVSLDKPLGADKDDCLKDMIDSGAPKPVDDLIDNEKESVIRNLLKEVPAEQRLVVELSVFSRLDYREIAGVLDIPYGTVKTRMRLAVARLKELVKK